MQGAALYYLDVTQNGTEVIGYACLATSGRAEEEQVVATTKAAEQSPALLFLYLEAIEDRPAESVRSHPVESVEDFFSKQPVYRPNSGVAQNSLAELVYRSGSGRIPGNVRYRFTQ